MPLQGKVIQRWGRCFWSLRLWELPCSMFLFWNSTRKSQNNVCKYRMSRTSWLDFTWETKLRSTLQKRELLCLRLLLPKWYINRLSIKTNNSFTRSGTSYSSLTQSNWCGKLSFFSSFLRHSNHPRTWPAAGSPIWRRGATRLQVQHGREKFLWRAAFLSEGIQVLEMHLWKRVW